MRATADLRRESLPASLGLGLTAMAIAAACVLVGYLLRPETSPGTGIVSAVIIAVVMLATGAAICWLVAREARSRRGANAEYEDSWARFAVELWPSARWTTSADRLGGGGRHSRTEFLLALSSGTDLGPFAASRPITRLI